MNKPAEWVERKTGISRFTTCGCVIAGGVLADMLISSYDPKFVEDNHLVRDAGLSLVSMTGAYLRKKFEPAIAEAGLSSYDFYRTSRFPILTFVLVYGFIGYLSENYNSLGTAAFIVHFPIKTYLLSSSNGTIGGLKQFARNAWGKLVSAVRRSHSPLPDHGLGEPAPEASG